MGFFDKIWSWLGKAFSFADDVVKRYNEIKEALPGLIELIEDLYNKMRPKVDDPKDPMTGDTAREELVAEVATTFTNSPLSIPESFIREALEVVHRYLNRPTFAFYDKPGIRAQANRVLRGLRNKYGER